MTSRFYAVYHVSCDAKTIEARAQALAIEQSVETPLSTISDPYVLSDIVGSIDSIQALDDGHFEVCIALATAATGLEIGQWVNMLFGNSSIHQDVILHDVRPSPELFAAFNGPSHGLDGVRRRVEAYNRALTCSALKPQGLSPKQLADLAGRMARGGIDVIKDDHGLADQAYSRFADRVAACADAVHTANAQTGGHTRYAPSLSGTLDDIRRQIGVARASGLDMLLIAPMIIGLPTFHAITREASDMAFLAHPAMAGAARIGPPLLLGKLFRLLGADATVFPNFGGRFGYTPETCRALAEAARNPWENLRPCIPVPAGGMTVERVPEMLSFYGLDCMLLIGGGLLGAEKCLTEQTAAFCRVAASFAMSL
ncbi:5-methylthioribulose-1-phosphate isomerase [Azospirillaceae bacterium]